MRVVDVAIIGGSLAGAACVRTLTSAGIDAIAIERDRFPREKVCGGFLSPGAVGVIEELGLLDTLRGAGAIEVRSARVRSTGREAHVAFRRPGLGVSRRTLDAVLGDHPAIELGNVGSVKQESDGRFRIALNSGDSIQAKVLIDAAGKQSRFGSLESSPQFGVQFYGPGDSGNTMDFWLFADGYGGVVDIEGGRSNSCFLIERDALPRYLGKPGCKVTGPVAYGSRRSEFLAIGDAAGMIDPFCGEGMHHALDTGRLAAASVICGLERGLPYAEIRRHYENERSRLWSRKRALARAARIVLRSPRLRSASLRLNLEGLMAWFWG